ncbi:MAG: NAD(+)/NADH kinase [Rhodothermales bacterium]
MTYGLTGNTQKEKLWQPAARLIRWFQSHDQAFCLNEAVAEGLAERGLLDSAICTERSTAALAQDSDLILSFGGDGTLLNTAHMIGRHQTPILGINVGRLGFLADIEVAQMIEAVERLSKGDFRIEERLVLEAHTHTGMPLQAAWALNEFVILRSGFGSLIHIDVTVDGVRLATYRADGLILSTATGSTAYNLSAGGPIIAPGTDALCLTPLAPHTLTLRPFVVSAQSEIEIRVYNNHEPFAFAADGTTTPFHQEEMRFSIRRANHKVRLVKLPEQHYFETLRHKLFWGLRKPDDTV